MRAASLGRGERHRGGVPIILPRRKPKNSSLRCPIASAKRWLGYATLWLCFAGDPVHNDSLWAGHRGAGTAVSAKQRARPRPPGDNLTYFRKVVSKGSRSDGSINRAGKSRAAKPQTSEMLVNID